MNDFLPNFDEIIKTADFNQVLYYSVAFIIAVLSGCWSSSIAEKKVRGTLPHLVIGLCIPVVYPLLILIILPAKKKKKVVEEPKVLEEEEDDLDELLESVFAALNSFFLAFASSSGVWPFALAGFLRSPRYSAGIVW